MSKLKLFENYKINNPKYIFGGDEDDDIDKNKTKPPGTDSDE